MYNRIVPLAIVVGAATCIACVAATSTASAYALPSSDACPAQKNPRAEEREQERALRCVISGIRASAGVRRLSSNRALERAAGRKAQDLAECGFSHTACGRPADAWADSFGYDSGSWRWGENIATGGGGMTARKTAKAWLGSELHRSTLLDGSFEHIGVGLERTGRSAYWVIEVGCHGC